MIKIAKKVDFIQIIIKIQKQLTQWIALTKM